MKLKLVILITALMIFPSAGSLADPPGLLVEAESFQQHGGWKLDTQFIDEMGSPYLLAHGIGQPVANAKTSVTFSQTGDWHVWVRTKDWTARWDAADSPGRFQLLVDGRPLKSEFGNQGENWMWQDGGTVKITDVSVELELQDLTGFDGRCDAIWFSQGDSPPPSDASLRQWRRTQLNLPQQPAAMEGYDLVVVGGGYSGMGAALSAARMGCKVALIQNRGVLGGNGSSEVRVWAMGNIRRGLYPRIGEIIEEFADKASKSPGTYEEFGDDLKEAIVKAEPNIDLFLNHHAFGVQTEQNKIRSVTAFDVSTSQEKQFFAPLFVDCTGHGTIGFLAGADWEMTPKGRMGMSNMWAWGKAPQPTSFPEIDGWALDLEMKDFPYPREFHGQWFWESGFDKDPLKDAEGIRDWNLRAVYGAFNAMKNRDGANKHKNAQLTWVAYVGGPRESRRLIGDVLLTRDDIVEKRKFKDGTVPTTWSIDLHYPKEQYAKKFADNPFISKAVHDQSVDRTFGYPVPYRCFYSKNIDNLFLAGRCVSVTHEALGTVRVMKTCGMMGEVVGKAASICRQRDCTPRDVHSRYWDGENGLKALLQLPGKARRQSVNSEIEMPEFVAEIQRPETMLNLRGLSMDDSMAVKAGPWKTGKTLKGFLGTGYQYAAGGTAATMSFNFDIKVAGTYVVRVSWRPHENRASNAAVKLKAPGAEATYQVNMKEKVKGQRGMFPLGQVKLQADAECSVTFDSSKADGVVCVDAVQLLLVE